MTHACNEDARSLRKPELEPLHNNKLSMKRCYSWLSSKPEDEAQEARFGGSTDGW